MLVKLTAKNQIILPKAAVSAVDAAEYFNVQVENGRIMLTSARDQLQRLGTSEQDVADAIAWARRVKIKQDRARRQKSWR
ncbi:AbrB family transcriptional regulator [Vandammella animalimorsus]|uniref:AbrB family transcriptional regulator n=1 Tax=Vandammella animalimorsus TaxID=2029117 RepID=A0A2A2AXK7_9BURK|nr:AbrB family transcriptional regulator [Vandammella animalimorsus]PAT42434.1 AbrB family transcriptional regulator [Vandammella animalimorsus]